MVADMTHQAMVHNKNPQVRNFLYTKAVKIVINWKTWLKKFPNAKESED